MQARLRAAFVSCGFQEPPVSASLTTMCQNFIGLWQQAGMGILRVRAQKAKPPQPHTASVIFAHGLGDTGEGWAWSFVEMAERLPHIEFLFPTAREVPVTCNAGAVMPAWYDIDALDADRLKMDAPGIDASAALLQAMAYLEAQRMESGASAAAGEGNVSANTTRVIVGGFSQGAALSLYAAHTLEEHRLGGIVALSGYCTKRDVLAATKATCANLTTPLLMCHGQADPVVPFHLGKESFDWIVGNGLRGCPSQQSRFVPLPGVGHESSSEEMQLVEEFIRTCLPPLEGKAAHL